MLVSQLSESIDLEATNQTLCGDLSLILTSLLAAIEQAISRSGGKPLAEEFDHRVNDYAEQHGWRVLTGLIHLTDLRERVPEVDAKMLSTVYASYAQYARGLARQILGTQLLSTTLASVVNNLPPRIAEINNRYRVICL
ncbi:MAG TPA: hypothetical protein VLG46_01585 [Anaerolineae bacterium]|nr:hypothetical protein [Anaerolineae bacterium]